MKTLLKIAMLIREEKMLRKQRIKHKVQISIDSNPNPKMKEKVRNNGTDSHYYLIGSHWLTGGLWEPPSYVL